MGGPYIFLFDECMTPTLRSVAKEFGHFGLHVEDLKRAGESDEAIAILARDRDCVMVTNNRMDFVRIYRRFELHAGLVIIVPNVSKELQRALFAEVLDGLRSQPDIANALIEVDIEGRVTVTDWPPLLPNDPST